MATITKKILPDWFEQILAGKKKFELRLADFDIKEGDTLRLEEWAEDPAPEGSTVGTGVNRRPTGRSIEKVVTYVSKANLGDWLQKQPEIQEKGFYVLQFD
jgi:hypothetical protein